MLQVSATDGKKWRPGILSLAAIGVIVMLFALYLASQFTQRVEAGYLHRTMAAWVDRNAAVSHISWVYAALRRIPAILVVFNPTVAVISALLAIELLLTGWRKSALNRLLFRRNFSARLLGEDGKLSERWIGVEWALDIRHLLTGKYALERRRAASSRQHPGMGRRLGGRPEGHDVRLGGEIDETGNAGGIGEF